MEAINNFEQNRLNLNAARFNASINTNKKQPAKTTSATGYAENRKRLIELRRSQSINALGSQYPAIWQQSEDLSEENYTTYIDLLNKIDEQRTYIQILESQEVDIKRKIKKIKKAIKKTKDKISLLGIKNEMLTMMAISILSDLADSGMVLGIFFKLLLFFFTMKKGSATGRIISRLLLLLDSIPFINFLPLTFISTLYLSVDERKKLLEKSKKELKKLTKKLERLSLKLKGIIWEKIQHEKQLNENLQRL